MTVAEPELQVLLATTVHPRTDTRVFSRVAPTLAAQGNSFLRVVVADGLGDETRPTYDIEDLGRPGRGRLGRMTLGTAAVAKYMLRHRPDVLHLVDPELLLLVPIARMARIKVVYEAHEDLAADIADKHWLPPAARPIVGRVADLIMRVLLRSVDHVIANTPGIAASLQEFSPTVVSNYPILPALTEGFCTSIPSDLLTCVYVGGITRIRGLTSLIDAMVIVNRTRPAQLILAGAASPASFLGELRRETGWRYVDYLGTIRNEEVALLYNRAQIGCITFLPAPNHIDAQPNKMFEYMAAGLPIVASDFPAWKDLITSGPFGVVCDPTSPESIADAILAVAADGVFASECSRRGRAATIEQFNWATESIKLDSVYEALRQPVDGANGPAG